MAGDPVRVLTTSSLPEGEIAKARLEDEGIPVLLKGGAEGPYPMGPVHLFVAAELEVQARLILAGTLTERGADPEDGEPLEDDRGESRGPG